MDEQNEPTSEQVSSALNSKKQAAYERSYNQAVGRQLGENDASAESTKPGGPSAANGGRDPQEKEAPSFADYVATDTFASSMSSAQGFDASGAGTASGRPAQPFVDNAYQQPWDSAQTPYGQSASASGGSGYEHTYAYQQAYNQARYATAGQQQAYSPYAATKDHVAAGLLAIFLGSLGIHKFYLGYNTAGFIMLGVAILGSLFTFGIAGAVMGVIALIEGIIYLTKSQRDFDAEYVHGHKEWF